MKVCNRCGEEKPLSEYYYREKSKDKKQPICKKCQTKLNNAYDKMRRPYLHEQFNRNKAWTKEDFIYLKNNIDQDSEELGIKLGRSWKSIRTFKGKIRRGELTEDMFKSKNERTKYKKCNSCKETKSIDEFAFRNSYQKYRQSDCKECQRKYHAERYRKIKETEKKFNKRSMKRWTKKEEEYILNNLDKSILEQAKTLKRSYHSVSSKRSQLLNS